MRKEIYLIKGETNESYRNFSDRVFSFATRISENKDCKKVKLNYTKSAPPKLAVIPFKKNKIAAISIYFIKKERNILRTDLQHNEGVYLVEEAIPVAYEKNWNDLESTPGVCLLTLFRKKKGIDHLTFIHRWHNGHTPLSLKVHPLWNYNRNVVIEELTETSTKWDGIVEEQLRTRADLLNPLKFFGNPLVMFFNMIRVYFDTKSFLEYKSIEPYFTTELHIKS